VKGTKEEGDKNNYYYRMSRHTKKAPDSYRGPSLLKEILKIF